MEAPLSNYSTGFQKRKYGDKLVLNHGGKQSCFGFLKFPITDKISKVQRKRKNVVKLPSTINGKVKQNGVNNNKLATSSSQKSRTNGSTRKPIIIKSNELLTGKKNNIIQPKTKSESNNNEQNQLATLNNAQNNSNDTRNIYFSNELLNYDEVNLASTLDKNLDSQIEIFLDNIDKSTNSHSGANDLRDLKVEISTDDLLNELNEECMKFESSFKNTKVSTLDEEIVSSKNGTSNTTNIIINAKGDVLNTPIQFQNDFSKTIATQNSQTESAQNTNDSINHSIIINDLLIPQLVTSQAQDSPNGLTTPVCVFLCPVADCGMVLETLEQSTEHMVKAHFLEVVIEGSQEESCHQIEQQPIFACGHKGCSVTFEDHASMLAHLEQHQNAFDSPGDEIDLATLSLPAQKETSKGDENGESGIESQNEQMANIIKKINERKRGQFVCSKCGATFKKQKRLAAHFRYHSDDRPFKCPEANCDWAFTSAYKLTRHVETHWGKKKYECDSEGCNKQFTTLYNLKFHKRLHERPNLIPCLAPNCLQTFSTKKKMEQHLKEHEDVEAPYKCPVESCGKPFYSYNIVVSHLRVHEHTEEDLTCPFPGCKKRYERMCRLRLHVRSHTGERPYQCDVPGCGWTFVSASKLTRHRKKHTGDRNYPCQQCGKCFMRPEHLRGHLVTHSGTKPFACPHPGCDAAFTAKSTLYVHIKKHTGATNGTKVIYPCLVSGCQKRYSCKNSLYSHLKKEHASSAFEGTTIEEYMNLIGGEPKTTSKANDEQSDKVFQENHSGSARTDFCHKTKILKKSSEDTGSLDPIPSTDVILTSSAAMISTSFLQDDYPDQNIFGSLSDLTSEVSFSGLPITLQDLE